MKNQPTLALNNLPESGLSSAHFPVNVYTKIRLIRIGVKSSQKVKNKEKKKLVSDTLRKNPYRSDRAIAKSIGGISHTYIGKIRKELVTSGIIKEVSTEYRKNVEQLSIFSIQQSPIIIDVIREELKRLPMEEIVPFKRQIERLVNAELESRKDNSLENGILLLNQDNKFNDIDTHFGHWLAKQITGKNRLIRPFAEKAHSMLSEYNITISPWKDIEHQYPNPLLSFKEGEKSLKLTRDEIVVVFPYDPNLVVVVKSVFPRGNFNPQDRNWYFPQSACSALVRKFTPLKFFIDPMIEGLTILQEREKLLLVQKRENEANKRAKELLRFINSIDLDQPLDNGWTLFEHQKEGVRWLLSRQKKGILRGGILADHMGLGKTIQTLVAGKYLSQHYNNCPILVICPTSLRDNWAKEADMIGIKIRIFSWGKIPPPLTSESYILIADEAHYAQNPRSKRSNAMLTLADHDNCVATWLLTGTPIKNGRPINLYPLLLACDHPLAKNKKSYELRFCNAEEKTWGWDNIGASHLDELAQKTEDVILRRTKKQCLDLLPKIRVNKQCILSNSLNKKYLLEINYYIKQYEKRVAQGQVSELAEALVTLNILRKMGSKYKVDTTLELANELLEQGEQVVIFTEFRESAQQLHQALGGELLLGDTPQCYRQSIIDRFQLGQSKIFVGTISAGGVGITLTASSHVILHDRSWTPGDAEQAEDRCHRIGQKDTVNAYWIQLGKIDEYIDSILTQKQERIDLVLKGKRKTLRGIKSTKDLAKELIKLLSK